MGFLAVFALVMLSGLQANMQFGKLVDSMFQPNPARLLILAIDAHRSDFFQP